jgi:hypothetical protein
MLVAKGVTTALESQLLLGRVDMITIRTVAEKNRANVSNILLEA